VRRVGPDHSQPARRRRLRHRGVLGALLLGKDFGDGLLQASGIIGSIFGAIIALLVHRAVDGRSRTAVR